LQKDSPLDLLPTVSSSAISSSNIKNMDEELILQQELIESPPFPYENLIRHEWGDFGGASSSSSNAATAHMGKGDLVFQRPNTNDYLVVETKHLRTDKGSTARTSRTASRRKVTEQAFRYGAIWRGYLGTDKGTVTMAKYTNESKDLALQGERDGGIMHPSLDLHNTDQPRYLHILGQMDYLTPLLWGRDSFYDVLTPHDVAVLEQQLFRKTFMVARIHPYLHQGREKTHSYTPESFQQYFERAEVDAKEDLNSSYQQLEDIADSVLNHSGFYQPFSPHFIVSPNSRGLLLQKVQAVLRRLKR
jgi:hypothetical protein